MQFHFSVVIGSQLADQQAAARCRLWHFSDVTAQADDVSSLGLFRCEHRDLILTRSAYDHKRVRPLKPMVGVVKSLGYYRRGPPNQSLLVESMLSVQGGLFVFN